MPNLWLSFSCVLVILPLLLLGDPGLYGDDFNMYQEMEKRSFNGAIEHWLNEYGWSYRPVGITILYTYYALLIGSPFLMYLGYQLCYLMLSLALYREIIKLTGSIPAGIFTSLFFIFFPFNPTAYWQISSLMMVVATLFTVLLMRPLLNAASNGSYKFFSLLSFCWLLLLFTYEQLLGVTVVIGICIVIKNYTGSLIDAIKNSTIPVVILGFVSIFFLVAYLSVDGNPKIVSLKYINELPVAAQPENILNTSHVGEVDNYKPTNRLESFFGRLESGVHFLLDSIVYSLNSLVTSGVSGYILIAAIMLLGMAAFFVPITLSSMTKKMAWLYFLMGSLWAVVTIAPFFLYAKVHIPPYTLMLPSIGLGIAAFGFYQLVVSFFLSFYLKWIMKILLAMSIMIFSLIQYGYYAGLQEELSYWNVVANKVQKKQIVKVANTIVVENIQPQNNRHIFWLEKAIGLRYISARLSVNVSRAVRKENQLLLVLDGG